MTDPAPPAPPRLLLAAAGAAAYLPKRVMRTELAPVRQRPAAQEQVLQQLRDEAGRWRCSRRC